MFLLSGVIVSLVQGVLVLRVPWQLGLSPGTTLYGTQQKGRLKRAFRVLSHVDAHILFTPTYLITLNNMLTMSFYTYSFDLQIPRASRGPTKASVKSVPVRRATESPRECERCWTRNNCTRWGEIIIMNNTSIRHWQATGTQECSAIMRMRHLINANL